VQRYKDIYSYYVKFLTENTLDTTTWFGEIETIRDLIYPSVVADPYYPQDYGYTPDDFLDSYTQALGAHVPVGLEPYVVQRYQAAMAQLVVNDFAPALKYFSHTPTVTGQELWFTVYAEDNILVAEVALQLTPLGDTTRHIVMYDDGQHHDRDAGDGFFGASAGIFTRPTDLETNIKATDSLGQSGYYSCDPILLHVADPIVPGLVINEFMADNETTIADENGEFDDWLEIYNACTGPVWLGDLFLTDDLGNPDKWQMPGYTLASGGFVLIWADEDQQQGPFHANFKLSKDGEEIGIYGPESMGFPTIDSIVFGAQQTDISFGRNPDAAPTWQFFTHPTPGYSNTASGTDDRDKELNRLIFYPNPCAGEYIYFPETLTICLYDLSGQLRLQAEKTCRIPVTGLPPGIYILKDEKGRAGKLVVTRR
jgi:hypothetical protein